MTTFNQLYFSERPNSCPDGDKDTTINVPPVLVALGVSTQAATNEPVVIEFLSEMFISRGFGDIKLNLGTGGISRCFASASVLSQNQVKIKAERSRQHSGVLSQSDLYFTPLNTEVYQNPGVTRHGYNPKTINSLRRLLDLPNSSVLLGDKSSCFCSIWGISEDFNIGLIDPHYPLNFQDLIPYKIAISAVETLLHEMDRIRKKTFMDLFDDARWGNSMKEMRDSLIAIFGTVAADAFRKYFKAQHGLQKNSQE